MSGYIKSTSHYYIPVHNSSVITKIIFLRELLSFYSPITLRGTDLSWCVPHCSPENSQQGSQFWQLGRLHWPPQPPCSSNQKSPANPPCLWSDNPTIALPTAHPVWGTKKEKSQKEYLFFCITIEERHSCIVSEFIFNIFRYMYLFCLVGLQIEYHQTYQNSIYL